MAFRPELLALPDPIEHTVQAHNTWIVSSIDHFKPVKSILTLQRLMGFYHTLIGPLKTDLAF